MQPPIRMLVADDALVVHQIFLEAAEQAPGPVKVIPTSSGLECMSLLGRGDIGLAFVDVHMPDMGGMEALWSARHQGSKTFVTLMSSQPNERCIELARQLKAYEFLEKPFTVEDVVAIINTYRRISAPTRALLVDDSMTVRKVMQKVLGGSIFHIEVEDVADGEAALARCRDNHFDIVFLDCNMPGLDGIATLERLKARHPDIKVVMISGQFDEQRERLALARGAVAFLNKPFYPSHIDGVLHKLFGLRSPHLVTRGTGVSGFEVNLQGRTITVEQKSKGHVFQYLWFRNPPHLRSTVVRENQAADRRAGEFKADAEKAALMELKRAALVA